MKKCRVVIDNKEVLVDEGTTILEAAKLANIKIPTLCHHPAQSIKANCRICLVETGRDKLVTACSTPVWDEMKVKTNSKLVRETQKGVLELILANHDQDCLRCVRNGNCELQNLCEMFNISRTSIEDVTLGDVAVDSKPMDCSNPSIVRDYSKCIKCNRCVETCQSVQDAAILAPTHRSIDYVIQPAFGKTLDQTLCTYCGQCITVCPVGAIYERDYIDQVWDAIDDENTHVVVQVAPAVRVAIGEAFGFEPGYNGAGKIAASLRRMGFDRVFDTNFTADLTIIEEGHELLDRMQNGGKLPMITSCSPGWINYMEGFFPDLIDNISTCKSPQQMFGTLSKTYYSEKSGIHPSKIFTVSVMPCTAKKYEAQRSEMNTYGAVDVDAVLTTRELARMIKMSGVDFNAIMEEQFDDPFGIATGAAVIFGATGGVMEAALRTVYEVVTGEELEALDFYEVRGLDGIKETEIIMNGSSVKVAVASGLSNAKKLMKAVREGRSDYAFIEIMACPGGCLAGGGQPISSDPEVKEKRMRGIYGIDRHKVLRKSHENPAVEKLYSEFLGSPNSHKAHALLHTQYRAKPMTRVK